MTNKDNYEMHYDEIDLKSNIWRKIYDYIFDHEFLQNISYDHNLHATIEYVFFKII